MLSDSQSKQPFWSWSLYVAHAQLALEIGVGLTAVGVLFMLMGVFTFFDAGLLAMGNVSEIKTWMDG